MSTFPILFIYGMLIIGARSIAVRGDIVRDFNRYAVENLKRCVWSKGCTAWYNKGNGDSKTVTAMYPGSALHYKGGILSIYSLDICLQDRIHQNNPP